MVWHDLIKFDMIWYDMIWYDMIWYDMIWFDLIWFDLIWFDLILGKDRKLVMTVEDLSSALGEQGISVNKPPYYQ